MLLKSGWKHGPQELGLDVDQFSQDLNSEENAALAQKAWDDGARSWLSRYASVDDQWTLLRRSTRLCEPGSHHQGDQT